MSKISNKWLKTPGGGSELQEIPSGVINGVNKDFVLTLTPGSGSLKVFLDGIKDISFTFNNANKTITMITPPALGQNIEAVYTA